MKIEITSYTLDHGILTIYATDLEHLSIMIDERRSPDHYDLKEIEFFFDTRLKSHFDYVSKWLHRQKIIHKTKPSTFGEALHAVIGTVTDLNSEYKMPFS